MPYKICDTNCSHGGCARLTRRILRPPTKVHLLEGRENPPDGGDKSRYKSVFPEDKYQSCVAAAGEKPVLRLGWQSEAKQRSNPIN